MKAAITEFPEMTEISKVMNCYYHVDETIISFENACHIKSSKPIM